MTLRKLHELMPWDERQIFRLREGRNMRGNHSSEEWQRIFANRRPTPIAPPVNVEVMDDRVLLRPDRESGQLELGAIVAGLNQFSITNPKDAFDLGLPFRLYPLIGTDAFTKPNSWRHRYWRIPMEVGRDGQRNRQGWEAWRQKLADEPARSFSVNELAHMAIAAIGGTLNGQEASDFWRANR